MIDRILLVLTGRQEIGEFSLTLEDARDHSPRFFSELLAEAHQHIRVKKNSAVYDLIVPPHADDVEGLALTDREGKFDAEFLREIVAKVHSGCIRFRFVEFEPKPRGKK